MKKFLIFKQDITSSTKYRNLRGMHFASCANICTRITAVRFIGTWTLGGGPNIIAMLRLPLSLWSHLLSIQLTLTLLNRGGTIQELISKIGTFLVKTKKAEQSLSTFRQTCKSKNELERKCFMKYSNFGRRLFCVLRSGHWPKWRWRFRSWPREER